MDHSPEKWSGLPITPDQKLFLTTLAASQAASAAAQAHRRRKRQQAIAEHPETALSRLFTGEMDASTVSNALDGSFSPETAIRLADKKL